MNLKKRNIILPITLIASLIMGNCYSNAMWDIKNDKSNTNLNNNLMTISKSNSLNITENTIVDVDRYATAATVSKQLYSSNRNVVLAMSDYGTNSKISADSYTGAILAGSLDCPMLYTHQNKLNEYTKNEIQRLKAKNIYIVGGTTQISESVEKELTKMGLSVKRLYGADRQESSLKIAQEINKNAKVEKVILVNGYNEKHLSTVALAGNSMNAPIIYIYQDIVSNDVLNFIKQNSAEVYIVGEQANSNNLGITSNVVSKVKQYAKSVKTKYSSDVLDVNLWFNSDIFKGKDNSTIVAIEKNNNVDTGFISVLVKKENAIPLIIDNNTQVSNNTKTFLKNYKINKIYKSSDIKNSNGYVSLYGNIYDNLKESQKEEEENKPASPEIGPEGLPTPGLDAEIPEVEPLPTPLPTPELNITENTIVDTDRYATAVKVSKQLYSSNTNVVLAMSEYGTDSKISADSYTGAILAGSLDCPMLYTHQNKLNEYTKNEIQRLKAKNIYIVGGTTQISESVEKELTKMGLSVKRLHGADRQESSLKIAQEINKNAKVEQVILVNGYNEKHLSAVALAGNSMNAPIIYIYQDIVSNDVLNFIKQNSAEVYIVGEQANSNNLGITSNVVSKVKEYVNAKAVKTKYSSDVLDVNLWFNSIIFKGKDNSTIVAIEKNNNVDTGFISVLAKKENAIPLIVDNNTQVSNDTKTFLKNYKINKIYKSSDIKNSNGYISLYENIYDNLKESQKEEEVNTPASPEIGPEGLPTPGLDAEIPEEEPSVPDVEPEIPEEEPSVPDVEIGEGDIVLPDKTITVTQSDSSYKKIIGSTAPETKVGAYKLNKKGKEIYVGKGVSDEDGNFTVKLNSKQKHGTEVILYTFNDDGEKENKTIITMKDNIVPEQPFVTNKVTFETNYIKGEAEKKTLIRVTNAEGNILAEKKCPSYGRFNVKIPRQKTGTKLLVYSIDEAGNTSEAEEVIVK